MPMKLYKLFVKVYPYETYCIVLKKKKFKDLYTHIV